MPMTFTIFPCISPHPPETKWGQILDLQSMVAVVQVERPLGGVREEGVAILTRLNRLLTQAPLERAILKSVIQTFSKEDVTNIILFSFTGAECTVGMRGDGKVYMRRGKTFAPLLRREGMITGQVKPQDILLLLSKEASHVLNGEEKDLFSQNLTPKEIAEAVSLRLAQSGSVAEGSVGCVISFIENESSMNSLPSAKVFPKGRGIRLPKIDLSRWKARLKERKVRSYLLVGLITLLFLISVVLGIRHQQGDTSYQQMIQALDQSQKLFDEGVSLMDSQPIKSSESLKQANDLLAPYIADVPKGKEGKAIEALSKQILDNLQLVQKVYARDPQLFYDASFLQKDRHINIFSIGEENISFVDTDNGMVGIVSLASKDAEVIAGGDEYKRTKFLTWRDTQLLIVTDTEVKAFDPGDKEGVSILPAESWDSIATFGDNFYGVSRSENELWRYPSKEPGFGEKEVYFDEDIHPDISQTLSVVIDGSVWFGSSIGKIFRYTQGRDDPFLIRGVDPPLGQRVELATNEDTEVIFVFDPDNKRVVILNKDGTYEAQYVWPDSFSPTSFAVSPQRKQMFFLADNKLFTLSVE